MKKIKSFVVIFTILTSFGLSAQTVLNSLEELKNSLEQSNGNFKMTPGTYYFNADNCGDGKLFDDSKLLFFTGSNNVFDFTDVKFEYNTEIFRLFGNVDVLEFWNVGDHNVYLNLTMEDIGNTTPTKGASSIHIDGADNRVEGFKTTTRGSFPYGYGDMFGKGGGSVINHNKHAGVLIRGERNHLKNCTVLMHAYGHGIFVQGAEYTKIEGCYVEGELRTVREVLAEEGTGSPADNVNFQTVWGFDLRDHIHDDTFSLQEAGIRAYSTGINYGDTESRATSNTSVIDCTIVKMRVGVNTGAEGGDDKLIENCTALACEVGFWLGHDGSVINCKGDASVGPLFSEDIGRSNATYDLTILDNYVPRLNPDEPYIFLGGNSHNFTIHDGTTFHDPNIKIQVGGTRIDHRWLAGSESEPMNRTGENLNITNNTKYPIVVNSNVSNSTINSCGDIIGSGSNNRLTQLENCNYTRSCNNTANNLQGECYDTMFGVSSREIPMGVNEFEIYDIDQGDWISFNDIDLTNISTVQITTSGNKDHAAVEVRQGSVDGNLLATVNVSNTENDDDYYTFSADLNQVINEEIDLYFVFIGGTNSLFNLDKIVFIENSCYAASYNPLLPIGAESFCNSSGVIVNKISDLNYVVGEIDNDDYIKFSNVDFGYDTNYNKIQVLASSTSNNASIEIRSGNLNGDLLTSIPIENTDTDTNYKLFSNELTTEIKGNQDIYLTFKGVDTDLMSLKNFQFYEDECVGVVYNANDEIDALAFCEMFGVVSINDQYLGGIHHGDWIRYGAVDFSSTAPTQMTFNVAGYPTNDDVENGFINVMLDDPIDGTLIATTTVPKTGGWEIWEEVTTSLLEEVNGIHEVYLYFGNGSFNVDWFEFHQDIVIMENLALATNGAIASQSTTDHDGVASRANDGSTNGNYGSGSVTHTEAGAEGVLKWWEVDLGKDNSIYEIVIHNRDRNQDRLVNYTVEIKNGNGNITYSKFFEDFPNPSIKIETGGVLGKTVRVFKTSDQALSLAEVQVFGTETLSNNTLYLTEFTLSSNPVSDSFTINGVDNYKIIIYNASGKIVLSQHINNNAVNVKNLNNGLYYVEIYKSGHKEVLKMIKK